MTLTVREELRKFAESTSVRGISRAIKSTDKAIRLIWALSVVACIGILVWQLTEVVQRYNRHESTTFITESKERAVSLRFNDTLNTTLYSYHWNDTPMMRRIIPSRRQVKFGVTKRVTFIYNRLRIAPIIYAIVLFKCFYCCSNNIFHINRHSWFVTHDIRWLYKFVKYHSSSCERHYTICRFR